MPNTATLDPLPLATQLVAVESISGNEGAVIALADSLLRERGWQTSRIHVSEGRENLLAITGDEPRIVFSTHLDTVPPFIPPRVEGSRLYGRGSCDAKGIAAAMICAGETLRDEGMGVGLLFVVGEETNHDGAHAANEWALKHHWRGLALINGEPTESKLASGTKGALRMTLRTAGIPAHSAYPHLGKSATRDLVRLLHELDTLELPFDGVLGATTVNIGMLSGGVADNVVAPSAEAHIMARIVTGEDEMFARFEEWIRGRAQIERGASVPAVKLDPMPGFETEVMAYATDVPNLTNWGKPYLFGPGSIHVAHRDDEHIEIEEMRAAVQTYVKMVREILK